MASLLVAPVLPGESHLLVHNDLAAEGVGAKANGDGNDDSYALVLVCMIPEPRGVLSYPMGPTQVGSV